MKALPSVVAEVGSVAGGSTCQLDPTLPFRQAAAGISLIENQFAFFRAAPTKGGALTTSFPTIVCPSAPQKSR
jgi:hypothetical protein